MDPITQAYMSILNESVPSSEVKTDLKVGAAFGDKENEKNVTSFIKGSGPCEVDGVEDPEEAPDELTSDVDSSLKKLKGVKEAKNPFDVLFNKIVSEETFNFSTGKENSFEPENAFDDSSLDETDETEEDDSDVDEFADSEDEESEEVTITLDKDMAEKLIEILQTAIGGEEEDEEEGEEEGEEEEAYEEGEEGEEGEEEQTFPESFALDDAEDVNVDKAVKGLTDPKSHKVTGTLSSPSKKSANVPKSGKTNPLKPHNTKPAVKNLQKKNQKVKSTVDKGEYFK